jgi:hypothetical protein
MVAGSIPAAEISFCLFVAFVPRFDAFHLYLKILNAYYPLHGEPALPRLLELNSSVDASEDS